MRYLLKLGGSMLKNKKILQKIAKDIGSKKDDQFVIVHGGGPNISDLMKRLGKEPVFVDGLRYTDQETMDIVEMALALTNNHLVLLLNQYIPKVIGINGISLKIIVAKKKGTEGDLGYVGEVESVNVSEIEGLLSKNVLPVIASVASSKKNEIYNINADEVASAIAARLSNLDAFIFVSDVGGVLRDVTDKNSIIDEITVKDAKEMIENKKIVGGMIPKIRSCIHAIECGVKKCYIVGEKTLDLNKLFKGESVGTIIEKI